VLPLCKVALAIFPSLHRPKLGDELLKPQLPGTALVQAAFCGGNPGRAPEFPPLHFKRIGWHQKTKTSLLERIGQSDLLRPSQLAYSFCSSLSTILP